MSRIQVDDIYDKSGTGSPNFPIGAVVSGVVTATSYHGDGSALTGAGIGTTGSINTSGIITATSFHGGSVNISGIITASSFKGDGSQLSGISVESWNQLDTWLYSP